MDTLILEQGIKAIRSYFVNGCSLENPSCKFVVLLVWLFMYFKWEFESLQEFSGFIFLRKWYKFLTKLISHWLGSLTSPIVLCIRKPFTKIITFGFGGGGIIDSFFFKDAYERAVTVYGERYKQMMKGT